MRHLDIKSVMLRDSETIYEAAQRIDALRRERAALRAPVDKLSERDRLTRYWKACFPLWQPALCRIKPNFALVHVGSFRRGLLHGALSLLPGHVPAHVARRETMTQHLTARAAAKSKPAQGDLFEIHA